MAIQRQPQAKALSTEDRVLAMHLNHLHEMEAGALAIYDTLLEGVEDDQMKAKIDEFRGDHERHFNDLKRLVADMGGQALDVERPPGLATLTIEDMKASRDDGERMLKFAIGERFFLQVYEAALNLAVPQNVRQVLERCRDDEDRHHRWATEQVNR